jgi:nitronate monooxygenase
VAIPPVVLAPLAGGPSTPELAAAVANAGGLGFVAAGYLSLDAFADQLHRARDLTDGLLGANLFVLEEQPVDEAGLRDYARELGSEGELGAARFDDDWLEEKLEAVVSARDRGSRGGGCRTHRRRRRSTGGDGVLALP